MSDGRNKYNTISPNPIKGKTYTLKYLYIFLNTKFLWFFSDKKIIAIRIFLSSLIKKETPLHRMMLVQSRYLTPRNASETITSPSTGARGIGWWTTSSVVFEGREEKRNYSLNRNYFPNNRKLSQIRYIPQSRIVTVWVATTGPKQWSLVPCRPVTEKSGGQRTFNPG